MANAIQTGLTRSVSCNGRAWCGQQDRLTTRFGRLSDVAREAAYLANEDLQPAVTRVHVYDAIRRGRHRAELPARRYRKNITDGTTGIQTGGTAVGQMNRLAVIQSGPLTFGFPSRITASIGVGTSGTVNIERGSGAVHTKGLYVLGTHPLAFSASVAFEQSYGGLAGDSTSGAEMVCLLSSLTGLPIRQDLAMTGAIGQICQPMRVWSVAESPHGSACLPLLQCNQHTNDKSRQSGERKQERAGHGHREKQYFCLNDLEILQHQNRYDNGNDSNSYDAYAAHLFLPQSCSALHGMLLPHPREPAMIFEQINAGPCLTYLVADEAPGQAALVDPILDRVHDYVEILRERSLTLTHVIDTHSHADHLSGAPALRDLTECIYAAHVDVPARALRRRRTAALPPQEARHLLFFQRRASRASASEPR